MFKQVTAGLMLSLLCLSSHAALVSYEMTATVSGFLNLGGGAGVQPYFGLGDTVNLNFSYDTASVGSCGPTACAYTTAIDSLRFYYSNGYAGSATDGQMHVDDSPGFDSISGYSQPSQGLAGPNVGSAHLAAINIVLTDTTGSAFASTALAPLPPLTAFNSTKWIEAVFQNDSGGTTYVRANLQTVNAVPIPAAAWLFGGALGLLGVLKRKQAAG
jgi:hypothetical protein